MIRSAIERVARRFLCGLAIALSLSLHAAEVGDVLTSNTAWTLSGSPYVVTNDLTVLTNVTLTIEAGVAVQLRSNVSLMAQAGGAIEVAGTAALPVSFRPAGGAGNWDRLGADGPNARLTLRHAEVEHGQAAVFDGASGWFEHCYFHDYHVTAAPTLYNQPILISERAAALTVRACRFRDYHETLFRLGLIVIEDSLFEDISGDGIDFDTVTPGSVIRRCTLHHGPIVNADAVDLGSQSRGVLVESCLMYDFPFDKGVSIGEQSTNITVRGCVMYGLDIGVAVKDSSVADIVNNTITDSADGLSLYQKIAGQGGGHAVAWNNILWNNTRSIALSDSSTITVTFSDVSGADVYPGTGNLNADPIFRNAALRDYRLATNSPCLGAGDGGTTLGALYPVGSFLADTDGDGLPDTWEQTYGLDFNSAADAAFDNDGDGLTNAREFIAGTNPNDASSALKFASVAADAAGATLQFLAAAGRGYTVEYCTDLSAAWQTLQDIPPSPAGRLISVTDANAAQSPMRLYRLVTAGEP